MTAAGTDAALELGRHYDPFDDAAAAELYTTCAEARRAAPVFWSDLLGCWVVSRHDDAHDVLTNSEVFSATVATALVRPLCDEATRVLVDGGWKHKSVFSADPPDHTRFRGLIQKVFTPKRIADFEPFIAAQVDAACDRMDRSGPVDVIADLCYPVPGLTILELLGFPPGYLADMKDGASTRIQLMAGRLSDEEQVATAHRLVESWHFARAIVDERDREPHHDLMSDLLAVRGGDDDVMTLDELTSMLLTFFSAGHETSTYMLANALKQLLADRPAWQALGADHGLIPNAVEEALRFDAPIYAWRRMARVETEVAGTRIAAGETVMVLLGSANRDETMFADPDRFDIRRDGARNHYAFSKGIHYCVGAPLARLEGKVALEGLVTRFPDLRLAARAPGPYLPSALFHGPQELWVQTKEAS